MALKSYLKAYLKKDEIVNDMDHEIPSFKLTEIKIWGNEAL